MNFDRFALLHQLSPIGAHRSDFWAVGFRSGIACSLFPIRQGSEAIPARLDQWRLV